MRFTSLQSCYFESFNWKLNFFFENLKTWKNSDCSWKCFSISNFDFFFIFTYFCRISLLYECRGWKNGLWVHKLKGCPSLRPFYDQWSFSDPECEGPFLPCLSPCHFVTQFRKEFEIGEFAKSNCVVFNVWGK